MRCVESFGCILISAAVWALSAEPGRAAQPRCYPLQQELESKLSEDVKDRERFAALFPFRFLADAEGSLMYLGNLRLVIDKHQWAEALPLIEQTLTWDDMAVLSGLAPRWGIVYLRLATRDMEPTNKAAFLVNLFKPGCKLRVQGSVMKELEGTGPVGRRLLYEFLLGTDMTFSRDSDAMIGNTLASHARQLESMAPTEAELAAMAGSASDYVRYVCQRMYAHRGDPRAAKMASSLFPRAPCRKYPSIRRIMDTRTPLTYCAKAFAVLRREGLDNNNAAQLRRMLKRIWLWDELWTLTIPPDARPDLIRELKTIAALPFSPGMTPVEEERSDDLLVAREYAKLILVAVRKLGDGGGEVDRRSSETVAEAPSKGVRDEEKEIELDQSRDHDALTVSEAPIR